MLSAPHLNSWAIIHLSSNQRELHDFITVFTKMATNINFRISQPIRKQLTEESTAAFITTLDRISSYYALQLIMIILPRRRTDLYRSVVSFLPRVFHALSLKDWHNVKFFDFHGSYFICYKYSSLLASWQKGKRLWLITVSLLIHEK